MRLFNYLIRSNLQETNVFLKFRTFNIVICNFSNFRKEFLIGHIIQQFFKFINIHSTYFFMCKSTIFFEINIFFHI